MRANRKRHSRRSEKRRPKEEERKNANTLGAPGVHKSPPRSQLYISDDVKRTLCAGCSANTSILCSIAAKYASISAMCPTCLAASRTSSVFSAGSRRCSFVVVVSSSTGVGDASPAGELFCVECWCVIASAENTPGLKNNNATIIVVASVILFDITEDCRRRMNDDDRIISSLLRARLLYDESGSLCGSFPAGLKKWPNVALFRVSKPNMLLYRGDTKKTVSRISHVI